MKLTKRDLEEIKSIAHHNYTNMTVEKFEEYLLVKSYVLAVQTFCARKNIAIADIKIEKVINIVG